MDTPATYFQLGFLVISIPNLIVIIGMVVVFLVALLAPFPAHRRIDTDHDERVE